jgi:hypothetical protein
MPATLSSNGGHAELAIEFCAPTQYAHEAGFESIIRFRDESWDGDHSFPIETTIEGVCLRARELHSMMDHIANWTSRPLDQLIIDDLNGDFDLTLRSGQRVGISFGPRSDTISDRKPVVSIKLGVWHLHAEFHFVTDQSCLAIFARQIFIETKEDKINDAAKEKSPLQE